MSVAPMQRFGLGTPQDAATDLASAATELAGYLVYIGQIGPSADAIEAQTNYDQVFSFAGGQGPLDKIRSVVNQINQLGVTQLAHQLQGLQDAVLTELQNPGQISSQIGSLAGTLQQVVAALPQLCDPLNQIVQQTNAVEVYGNPNQLMLGDTPLTIIQKSCSISMPDVFQNLQAAQTALATPAPSPAPPLPPLPPLPHPGGIPHGGGTGPTGPTGATAATTGMSTGAKIAIGVGVVGGVALLWWLASSAKTPVRARELEERYMLAARNPYRRRRRRRA